MPTATSSRSWFSNTYKPQIPLLFLLQHRQTSSISPSIQSFHPLKFFISIAVMKIHQLIALAALSVIPALALPESSNLLKERAYTFTCSPDKYPVCCEEYVGGVSKEPTGTGTDCVSGYAGCTSTSQVPACCLAMVSSFIPSPLNAR